MANELEKLLGFLSSPPTQAKNAVVDIVRLTGSDEGLRSLAAYSALVFPRLVRLLRGTPETAAAAAEALVNLSQHADLATKLVSHCSFGTVIDVLYKSPNHPVLARGLVMLLTNLTQVESGVAALLQIEDDKVEGLNVAKLVSLFCRSSSSGSADDTFEHVASILVNISKVEAGRKILLDPRWALLKQVIHQFYSTNPLRKKGVADTVRNFCFEAEEDPKLLQIVYEDEDPKLKKAYEKIRAMVAAQSDTVKVKGLKCNGGRWSITIKSNQYGPLHIGPFDDMDEAQKVRDHIIHRLGINRSAHSVYNPHQLDGTEVWNFCKNINKTDLVAMLQKGEFYSGYKSFVRKGKSLEVGKNLPPLQKKALTPPVRGVKVSGVQRSFSHFVGEKKNLSDGGKGPVAVGKAVDSSSPMLRKNGSASAGEVGNVDQENMADKDIGTDNIFMLKLLSKKLQQQLKTAEGALIMAKAFNEEILTMLGD